MAETASLRSQKRVHSGAREKQKISREASRCSISEFTRNENGKKAIGLNEQNNNFARASSFLYIPLPSLRDYNVKLRNFTFCRGREQKTTTFFFFSWTLMQSFRIQLQKNWPTFDELNGME